MTEREELCDHGAPAVETCRCYMACRWDEYPREACTKRRIEEAIAARAAPTSTRAEERRVA